MSKPFNRFNLAQKIVPILTLVAVVVTILTPRGSYGWGWRDARIGLLYRALIAEILIGGLVVLLIGLIRGELRKRRGTK
jgi:hypothetical protein